jgi:hypothetical protein
MREFELSEKRVPALGVEHARVDLHGGGVLRIDLGASIELGLVECEEPELPGEYIDLTHTFLVSGCKLVVLGGGLTQLYGQPIAAITYVPAAQ